ncbi:MAG: hypothetical protein Fur009_2610 [Candidatus Microgenomates bacterium]
MPIATIALILVILIGFLLMTFRILDQEITVPLVALISIILAGPTEGYKSLHNGFAEFSKVALLFTAVAIPAHMLESSGLFNFLGSKIGELVGYLTLKFKMNTIFLISFISIITTYVLAALFHNTTSILVNSYIIYVVAKQYKIPAAFILSGALIASNLGGFSTRWGDTPNIVESSVWGLKHIDFFKEILPVNIFLVIILTLIVFVITYLKYGKSYRVEKIVLAHSMIRFKTESRFMVLDIKLIFFGILSLTTAIVGSIIFPAYEVPLSALGIIIAIVGTSPNKRKQSLYALGIGTYFTLLSIFVLAQVFGHSKIGINGYIESLLSKNSNSILPVLWLSYLGTLSTEAASWATAVSPIVYKIFPTHLGAWALGAGICAGSSSLITAASAGIILAHQTSNYEEGSRVDFPTYLKIGLLFSLFMLLFYSIILPLYINFIK